MGIYGNQIKEIGNEVVLEMHFTKKQLQDPKQIERILKSKNLVKNMSDLLSLLTLIIAVIGSIATLGIGLIPFIGLFAVIYSALEALPEKTEDKNLLKFINACEDYKRKLQNKLKDDPDNEEIKNIISKLDKNIELARGKYTDKISDKYKQKINEVKKIYRNLEKWLNNPYRIGDGYDNDIFLLAQYANIPEQVLIEKIKNSNIETVNIRDYFGEDFGEDSQVYNNEKKIGCESFKEIKNTKLPVKLVYDNDDCWIVFLPSNSKLLLLLPSEIKVTSLYKEFNKEDLFDRYDKDIIIDADKELGYYIFSNCPANVKKKKFI